jgi:mediator of DNA damage checkpoint protein 1
MILLMTLPLSWTCSISGNKATKARNWSIPVVNHTWLEDCFVQWRNLSVGLEKYIVFPPGLDFSDHLGERGMQREAILETLPDLVAEMALSQDDNETPVETGSDHRNGESLSQMAMKLTSARGAKETGDAMGRPGTEHPMDIDARSEPAVAQEAGGDYMQVDEPMLSRGPVQNLKPKTGISSGRAGEGSSPPRQATHPPQRIHEDPSSTRKRRRRDVRETSEEDVRSPTKNISEHVKSAPIATGSFVEGPSKVPRQKSPSKSPPTTPLSRLDSVLMPPIGTGEALALQTSLRQSPATKAKAKASPVKPKSKGDRVSRMESTSVEHSDAPPLSSFIADTTTDREEGPSAKRTSRRSAANKATQRLREEVMPDVVNFEKEMRRGQVRAANFSPKSEHERGQEKAKTDLLAKQLGKGLKRPSIQHAAAVEEDAFSDGEHEHERAHKKRRRLSNTRSHRDRFKDRDDDGRTDVTGANSQGAEEISSSKGGAGKGKKLKKGDSQSGQVEIEHLFSSFRSPPLAVSDGMITL